MTQLGITLLVGLVLTLGWNTYSNRSLIWPNRFSGKARDRILIKGATTCTLCGSDADLRLGRFVCQNYSNHVASTEIVISRETMIQGRFIKFKDLGNSGAQTRVSER